MKTANWFRFSCRLTPHVAWKESALAFVCHTIPTPMGSSVWRKGGSISGTWRRLVVAAIRVSTAISIRRDRVVGVRVMNTRVCSTQTASATTSAPLVLVIMMSSSWNQPSCRDCPTGPNNPVADYSSFAQSMILLCGQKIVVWRASRKREIATIFTWMPLDCCLSARSRATHCDCLHPQRDSP